MSNLPSDNSRHLPTRRSRRSLLVAVAAMLTLHPIDLPPLRFDFHVTVDTRSHTDMPPPRNAHTERN